ncbi:hypothetical protein ACHHYP_02413 [Achlya hypogyna]|uniref:Uncharacterized protein n=1 Tax=Achlya hypogyna TaxID=1202772 RepID=A0A1V9Z6D5_ACHHY|nr:hypothetical protein ACHHYP_02413 [Achlya hypogyna]
MTMTDFEMDESDILFGDEPMDMEEMDADMDYLLDESVLQKLRARKHNMELDDDESTDNDEMAAMEPASLARSEPTLRSHSMPTKSFLTGDEQQKWRRKYLSRLKIAKDEDIPSRLERRSPAETETRRLRAMSMAQPSSGPIQIPLHPSSTPASSSVPLRRLDEVDDDADRYRRHLDRLDSLEKDDGQFVPPHQMIDRGCFSLGMKHHFRQKPGNI